MFRFTIRDVLYLLALTALTVVWWFDRSMLANSLKNCRFAVEHQRELIDSLTSKPSTP